MVLGYSNSLAKGDPTMSISTEPLLKPSTVASLLQVSTNTLAALRNAGTGPPYLRLGSSIRYRGEDVDAWAVSSMAAMVAETEAKAATMEALAEAALLTDLQVATILSLSPKTLALWRYSGAGPVFVKLGASVRYRREDVDRWVATNASAPL